MTIISAVEWIPAGVADPNPRRYEYSAEEMAAMEELVKGEQSDEQETTVPAGLPKVDASDLPPELNMDEYSDTDENVGDLLVNNDDIDDDDSDDNSNDEEDMNEYPDDREYTPTNMEGLLDMQFSSKIKESEYLQDDDDSNNSDLEDTNLKKGDALLLVAKTDETDGDAGASLDVMVYERFNGNLYVHHDIPLPSFPLSICRGDISPGGQAGNFAAIGMFDPGIEVWNLDVLDALEPVCVLGGEIEDENDPTFTKQKYKNDLKPGSHTDAIMGLSWNQVHRQVIVSGSADKTVKLWDITNPNEPVSTFKHHKDKVQSVLWHPSEGTLFATGSYDRTVALVDARTNDNGSQKRVKIPSDIEALAWDPFREQNLTAASEDGTIMCWDVRIFDKGPVWKHVAHEFGGVSDISYSPVIPGLFATCAVDKTVCLWDAHNVTENAPKRIMQKDMNVGKLYSVSFYPSANWLLSCGGAGTDIAIWDMTEEEAVQNIFGSRVGSAAMNNDTAESTSPEAVAAVEKKDEDFEAMMKAGDEAADKARENERINKKKKKKGKKSKAHKR